MSTSFQDRTRNVARPTSLDIMKYIMRTASQIRKGDIRRTMSPDQGENVMRTTSHNEEKK